MTDVIAERARKLGGSTLRSIGDISRHQRLEDNNNEFVAPKDMLAERLNRPRHRRLMAVILSLGHTALNNHKPSVLENKYVPSTS